MSERILKLALELTGGGEGDRMLLAALCAVAEDAWLARLREDVTAEDCGEALPCAAAFTVAADLAAGGDGAASFSAGDVSVNLGNSADRARRAESLRQAAERLMEPFVRAEGLWVRGVEG